MDLTLANLKKIPFVNLARKIYWKFRHTQEVQQTTIRCYHRMVQKVLAQLHFARLGYGQLLASRPITAIPPDWADLWFLYRAVRRRKRK